MGNPGGGGGPPPGPSGGGAACAMHNKLVIVNKIEAKYILVVIFILRVKCKKKSQRAKQNQQILTLKCIFYR